MPDQVVAILDRLFTPPRMPAGAHLPGLLGRSPAVRAAMETEWKRMALDMFLDGVSVGMIAALVIAVAMACRGRVWQIIREAVTSVAA